MFTNYFSVIYAKILKLKLKLINFLFYYLNSTRITIFAKTNVGLGTW